MKAQGKVSAKLRPSVNALRRHALSFPEVHEDFPSGHSAFKVRGKSIAFLHADSDTLSLSAKLPRSARAALNMPFAQPTGYGLGRSGWVSAHFTPSDQIPVSLLCEWLDESYRAIAPKNLVAELDGEPPAARDRRPPPERRSRTSAPPPPNTPKKSGRGKRGRR